MVFRLSTSLGALVLLALTASGQPAAAQGNGKNSNNASPPPGVSDLALDARDALRRRDAARLVSLRDQAAAQRHTLASWIDYWELGNRLAQAQQADLDAFYARWPSTYVEDRLRNDWLLELGRRRDWVNLVREVPRFRMNDDREVSCYALLTEQLDAQQAGRTLPPSFKARAIEAWEAQRDLDDGCQLMATTLYEAKVLGADDAWRRARLAAEANRPRVARMAAVLAAPTLQSQVGKTVSVLMEKNGLGHTEHFAPVKPNVQLAPGSLAEMRIVGTEAAALQGCITAQGERRYG